MYNKKTSHYSEHDKNSKKKAKKAQRKKTRRDRIKERLRPKPTMVSFTSSFLNEVCRANDIPVLQEKWMFKKSDF